MPVISPAVLPLARQTSFAVDGGRINLSSPGPWLAAAIFFAGRHGLEGIRIAAIYPGRQTDFAGNSA